MGLHIPILRECKREIKFLCANNMHLLDNYGFTSREILKDGFKIDESIYCARWIQFFTTVKSLEYLFSRYQICSTR